VSQVRELDPVLAGRVDRSHGLVYRKLERAGVLVKNGGGSYTLVN